MNLKIYNSENLSHFMNFVPIRTSTLQGERVLGFNLYIKLKNRYLLYVKTEDDIESSRLVRLKKDRVKKLYIEDKDEKNYQDFLDLCLNSVLSDENVSNEKKVDYVGGVSESAAESIHEKPAEKESFVLAEKASQGLVSLLSSNEDNLKLILERKDKSTLTEKELLHVHSVNSSSLSIKFGLSFGLSGEEVHNLGVAALYHDVGYIYLEEHGQKSFFKKDEDLTPEERKEYEQHPQKAIEHLQDKDFVTKDILDLILTHEERLSGDGFPNKLNKLSPVQEIHALCCHYDTRVTLHGEGHEAVIGDLLINGIGKFNLETLKSFKSFMKGTFAD